MGTLRRGTKGDVEQEEWKWNHFLNFVFLLQIQGGDEKDEEENS